MLKMTFSIYFNLNEFDYECKFEEFYYVEKQKVSPTKNSFMFFFVRWRDGDV